MKTPLFCSRVVSIASALVFSLASLPSLGGQPIPAGGQWELYGAVAHTPGASLRNIDDRIRSTRYTVGSGGRFAVGNQGFAGLTFRASTVLNSWSATPARWGDYRELDFGVRYVQRIDESWSAVALGGMQMAAEKGTSLSSGDTYGLGGIVQYRVNPTLSIGLGALYNTRLDRSNRILPLASIEWRISENWHLTSANGLILRYFPLAEGPHQFEGSILWSNVQFRATAPDGQRFSVEEKGWRLSFAYSYQHSSGLHIRPFVALNERRDFEVRAGNARLDRFRTGIAPSVGLSLQWRF